MKKLICLTLIVTNLFMLTAFAERTALSQKQKEDLYSLNIMTGDENGDLHLDDNITRAETVKMLCVASGNISENPDFSFPDVDKNHWALKYIAAAKESGIVSGDENGRFNPESNVTNEEFVKMIVCLLGYGEMANSQGGYPGGYAAVASRLKITENLKLTPNTYATRNDVAIMMCNALDVPLMIAKQTDEATEYFVADRNGEHEKITLRSRIISQSEK